MMCFKAKTFYELDEELSYYDIGDLDEVSLNYCISRCNDPISKILNKYNLNKDNKIKIDSFKFTICAILPSMYSMVQLNACQTSLH